MNTAEHTRSVRGTVLPFPSNRSEAVTIVPPSARPGDSLIFYTVGLPPSAELEQGDVLIARTNFDQDEIADDTLCLVDDAGLVIARRPRDYRHAKLKEVNKLPPPPHNAFEHCVVIGLVLAVVRTL